MDKKECSCSEKDFEKACRTCGSGMPFIYWCETCQRLVAEKRCPGCGLKTRKTRQPG